MRTDVANNAGAHGHHDGHGGKIATRLQECGGDEEQADEEQGGGGSVVRYQLGGVPIEVVHQNVFRVGSCRVPIHELVLRGVDAEEHLQHRDERNEGEDVEYCR